MSIRLNVPIVPENATYTACWCEENIYLLGRSFLDDLPGFRDEWKPYVAFMSNESKTVLICQAEKGIEPGPVPGHHAILWDYHVILILMSKQPPVECFVYDFDSRLLKPSSFEKYVRETFPLGTRLNTRFESWFRVVPLQKFIDYFASDRSHMLRSAPDDSPVYSSPPPIYPCIRGSLSPVDNNLFDNYVGMRPGEVEVSQESLATSAWEDELYGKVMTSQVFYSVFSS